jgi:NCAIR mutase (PurE)-related protein
MVDARLDLQRRRRLGMVEAIWGEHKTRDQIIAILKRFEDAGELGLVTRVDATKAEFISTALPQVKVHPHARCLTMGALPTPKDGVPEVAVISGGSSDRTVVAEASLALQCHGIRVDTVMDVGVAGLHRLLDQLPRLQKARVLIVCAGMEGALPTVITGLVPQPVIGVPVSCRLRHQPRRANGPRRNVGELCAWIISHQYRQRIWSGYGSPANPAGLR